MGHTPRLRCVPNSHFPFTLSIHSCGGAHLVSSQRPFPRRAFHPPASAPPPLPLARHWPPRAASARVAAYPKEDPRFEGSCRHAPLDARGWHLSASLSATRAFVVRSATSFGEPVAAARRVGRCQHHSLFAARRTRSSCVFACSACACLRRGRRRAGLPRRDRSVCSRRLLVHAAPRRRGLVASDAARMHTHADACSGSQSGSFRRRRCCGRCDHYRGWARGHRHLRRSCRGVPICGGGGGGIGRCSGGRGAKAPSEAAAAALVSCRVQEAPSRKQRYITTIPSLTPYAPSPLALSLSTLHTLRSFARPSRPPRTHTHIPPFCLPLSLPTPSSPRPPPPPPRSPIPPPSAPVLSLCILKIPWPTS